MSEQTTPTTNPVKMFRVDRGAAWRWLKAKHRVDASVRSNWLRWPKYEDETIKRIVNYLWRERGGTGAASNLTERDAQWTSNFRTARGIYESHLDQIVVESLVLARVPEAEISDDTGIPVDAIHVYKKCFFDVCDILDAKSALAIAVFDRPGGETNDQTRVALLRLSYVGGKAIAKACIDYLHHIGEHHDLSTETGITRKEIDLLVQEYLLGDQRFTRWTPKTAQAMQRSLVQYPNLPTIASLLASRVALMSTNQGPQLDATQSSGPTTEFVATVELNKKSA